MCSFRRSFPSRRKTCRRAGLRSKARSRTCAISAGGADRTGSLAYVLCGVLGVSRNDLELDWEATFYPEFREMREEAKREGREYWSGLWHFDEGFSAYGDASSSWNERIRLYLLDCGITPGEIETLRRLMLEE